MAGEDALIEVGALYSLVSILGGVMAIVAAIFTAFLFLSLKNTVRLATIQAEVKRLKELQNVSGDSDSQ